MKKLLAFLVCAVVITGQLLLPVTGRQAIMPGDLNKSRNIEATDALICLQGAVGKYELNDDLKAAADVDANEKINATDALLILQYAVGKIAIFPSAGKRIENMEYSLDGKWDFYVDKNPKISEAVSSSGDDQPAVNTEHPIIAVMPSGKKYAAASELNGTDSIIRIPVPLSEISSDMNIGITSAMMCDLNGGVVLKGATDAAVVITKASGETAEFAATVDPTDYPIGFSLETRDRKSANLSFSGIDTSDASSAVLKVKVNCAADAVDESIMAFISVNGNWQAKDLSGEANGEIKWVSADVPVSSLKTGLNKIIFDSNVQNGGNNHPTSFDLYHCQSASAAGKSYISTDLNAINNDEGLHADRDLFVELLLKNQDGRWTTVAYNQANATTSCVVGLFTPQGLKYYSRQDFEIDDISKYTEAKIRFFCRIGVEAECELTADDYAFLSEQQDVGLTLGEGRIAEFAIELDGTAEKTFSKLEVGVKVNSNYEGFAPIYARVNGGEWRKSIQKIKADQTIEAEFPVLPGDVRAGENKIEIKCDSDKVSLCGTEGAMGASFIVTKTGREEQNVVVTATLTVYTIDGLSGVEAEVPGVWETIGATDTKAGEFAKYDGVGWYQKSFESLDVADDQSVRLYFSNVDYAAEVWLNGIYLGYHEGGYTGFYFDVDSGLFAPEGEKNLLTVRVCDQTTNEKGDYPIKETLAGFLQDSIGMNYAGIWGSVKLIKLNDTVIEDVYVRASEDLTSALVTVSIANRTNERISRDIAINITDASGLNVCSIRGSEFIFAGSTYEHTYSISIQNAKLWSAEDPNLYTVDVYALDGTEAISKMSRTLGMRTIKTNGNKFVLNGKNIFLTGVIDWMYNYETFSPAMPYDKARKQIQTLKDAGFNAIKFVLVVPPEYYLDICDEIGMYTYIEYPIWNPVESGEFYNRAYSQLPEMIKKDRSHPSLIMSDFNCEMHAYTTKMDALMKFAVETGRTLAESRLYVDNSTNGVIRYGDYNTAHPYNQLNEFDAVTDGWVSGRGTSKPLVFGEYADTDTLRDIKGIEKEMSGSPWWWKTLSSDNNYNSLKNQGYTDEQIEKLVSASFKNAQAAKMWYVQNSKKNGTIGGLFLTTMRDINSCRTGVFDDLGNFKLDIDAIKGTVSDTSISIKTESRNVWGNSTFKVTPVLSYYSSKEIINSRVAWALTDTGGKTVSSGKGDLGNIANAFKGDVYTLGELEVDVPGVDTCTAYKLTIEYSNKYVTVQNTFDFWAYPKKFTAASGVQYYDPDNILKISERYKDAQNIADGSVVGNPKLVVATKITDSIKTYVKNGGKLVYAGKGNEFMRTSDSQWFSRVGMSFVLDSSIAAVGGVASEGYGCEQFIELATQTVMRKNSSATMLIGQLDLRSFNTSALMQQCTYGSGSVIQTTMRLGDEEIRVKGSPVDGNALWQDSYENVIGRYLLDCMIKSML